MAAIAFFTDEDVYGAVAAQLRAHGLDARSTPEEERLGEDDESQLEFAAQNGYCLVTFNAADFVRIHGQWMAASRSHAGLVVSGQRPVGDVVRRLLNLANTLNAGGMQGRIEFLSNW